MAFGGGTWFRVGSEVVQIHRIGDELRLPVWLAHGLMFHSLSHRFVGNWRGMVGVAVQADKVTVARPDTLVGINMLRGGAAFAVVVHHAIEETLGVLPVSTVISKVALAGAAGVDIFFVISGFIMMHTSWDAFGAHGAARDFLARRLIRIVPLYWFCTFIVLALALTGAFYKSMILTGGDTVRSLLFLPTQHLVHGIGWTLQYEMYFYLLFAAGLLFTSRRMTAVLVPLFLVVAMVSAAALPDGPTRHFLTNPIALEFAFGIGLAMAFRARWSVLVEPSRRFGLMIASALGFTVATMWAASDGTAGLAQSVRFLAWGVPAALLTAAALTASHTDGRLRGAINWLGDRSYSLYLTHAFVMTGYAVVFKRGWIEGAVGGIAGIAGAIGVSCIVAAAVYAIIERPTNSKLRAWWRRDSRVPHRDSVNGILSKT